jgi:Fe-S-cluster-containing dehydrogenase component/DMSO reductase anchor subunit
MGKNAFIFDSNKCVGCNACVAGCIIENGTSAPLNWRAVNSHNKIKHPDLPVFHFSLACNHCDDAPCMKNCPALAYTRDKETGAIIHHAEACIGCTYCTWACPYDAPKFNTSTHIVEKCNFCVDRISEGLKPACAEACPVGALSFSANEDVDLKKHISPGFVNVGIKPSIQLVPLRDENAKPEIENIDAVEIDRERAAKYLPKPKSKVDIDKEWTLVLFTLAASGLVAWQASGIINNVTISPIVFIALGIAAIILTSLHIGKKFRMWRFMLNLKESWLSREIFGFSAFFGLGSIALLMRDNFMGIGELLPFVESEMLGSVAMFFGIFTLISIDMVYRFLIRKDSLRLHSGMVWSTGILFFACFSDNKILFSLLALLKAGLYIWRKISLKKQSVNYFSLISVARVLALLIPCVLFFILSEISLWILFPIVFIGEIIDRSEFYYESEVRTPQKELGDLFLKAN